MPGVPSNKACERCKKRHLKCDEARPHCQRCATAGVECPGYVQTRKFIDQGASVRRRYAPYQENATKPANTRNLPSTAEHASPAPAPTEIQPLSKHGQSHVELRQPSPNIQAHSVPHTEPQGSSSTPSEEAPIHQDATNYPASRQPRDGALGPVSFQSGSNIPGAQNIVETDTENLSRLRSRSPSRRSERDELRDIFSELMTGTEHELSFLVRHYSEALASWFDISDTGKFFEAYVPVRAIDEQLLRFAIAALSAKHLGRMKGVKFSSISGMFTSPATMEMYPNARDVDWALKAANYYYIAVSHMNSIASDAYSSISSSAVLESPIAIVSRWFSLHLKKSQRAPLDNSTSETLCKRAENLLAASTILTLYKIIDEPGENWQSHLAGIKPLFSQVVDLLVRDEGNSTSFPRGVMAVFWIFARLDYLSSYYNRLPTHLDSEDLPLWKAAGLRFDDQGNYCPSNDAAPSGVSFSHEDYATDILTWLMNKVTNFLAAAKRSQLEQWVGAASSESSNSNRTDSNSLIPSPTVETWLKLSFEFQSWFERVPETFRPCLRLEQPKLSASPRTTRIPFPEIFYSLTSCVAAMQQYHFGRLALSLNRPSDEVAGPSTAIDRLQGYRDLTKEVDYRCREICGAALGRPQGGARVQMITSLYAVGLCLEKPDERQVVIDLLRGIDADLGWATASHIQKLQG